MCLEAQLRDEVHLIQSRLSVQGMSCASCVSVVEEAIRVVDGVVTAEVNFVEHTATVEGTAATETVIKAIRAAGALHADFVVQ